MSEQSEPLRNDLKEIADMIDVKININEEALKHKLKAIYSEFEARLEEILQKQIKDAKKADGEE